MRNLNVTYQLTLVVFATTFSACVPGQYATLPGTSGSTLKKQGAQTSGDQSSAGQDGSETGSGSGSGGTANATPSPSPGTATPKPGLSFAPGVPETDALRKCLNLWGTTPFKEVKANQVKVMGEIVSVIGVTIGNPKDLESTPEPRLIVLPLSVNVASSTTFELLNPNGWYCIKAAVGARSTVNIKLHCSAKIAQSDLGIRLDTKPTPAPGGAPTLPVNVGINDGRTPGSQLGIMVDSSVNLTRVDSAGNACPP
ncbi:MAG: hypothetical protein FJY29_12040 [Betaproteobacteria bacterium]|nr:hypothetical protein [Betaproteobacteria bacterium]